MDNWTNCYDDSWKDIIVPEAFAHPAKMAYGLLKRILHHAASEGWIKPGQVIVDPFGGIGSTGILGAYEGYQVVCCELEAKFKALAEQNFKLHAHKWDVLGCPQPVILQGDSRQLCSIVEKADIVVSSPPFMEQQEGGGICKTGTPAMQKTGGGPSGTGGYRNQAQTEGNLAAMKPGSVDSIISSPPYAEQEVDYGDRPNRAAKIKDNPNFKGRKHWANNDKTCTHYGKTEGQLSNLKPGSVEAIVSSPPWENNVEGGFRTGKFADQEAYVHIHAAGGSRGKGHGCSVEAARRKMDKDELKTYGNSAGQIGNDKGPTFWQAARTIVQQCHQILKPGGHAIWVVKSFVRKGQIVDFPGDWRRLCESAGFKTVCVHHAMLVKETRHPGFWGEIIETVSQKSFFRRLCEAKGSPEINYEVVICCEKPTAPPAS